MTETHMTIRIPKKVLFTLVPVLLVVALGEGVQRFLDHRKEARQSRSVERYSMQFESATGVPLSEKAGSIVLSLDPHLMFKTRPGQNLPGITIGDAGFRGGHWNVAKPAGTFRVVVLGGSSTFGYGATSDDTTFPAILEKRLRERAPPGKAVEVLNAGMLGFNSTQELILYATELVNYDADAIIVSDGWNDFHHSILTPPGEPVRHPWKDEIEHVIVRGTQTFRNVLRTSALFGKLERVLGMKRFYKPDSSEVYDNDSGLSTYRVNLRTLCRLGRASGAKVLLVPQPEAFQRREPVPEEERTLREAWKKYGTIATSIYPKYVQAASEVAQNEGAVLVDLSDPFDDVKERVFLDWCHLNDRGNEIVADRLVLPVAQALGLPGR